MRTVSPNMTYIGLSTFPHQEPFPNLSSAAAYKTISMCITAPICEPTALSTDYSSDAVRELYGEMSGSSVLQMWEEKLENVGLMQQVYQNTPGNVTFEDFIATVSQIQTEVGQIKLISGWYQAYGSIFTDINSQMDEAFTTTLTLIDMPASTQVAVPGHSWFDIVIDVVEAVADCINIGGNSKGDAAFGKGSGDKLGFVANSINAVADVTEQSVDCAENCKESSSVGDISTPSPNTADNDAATLEFTKVIALLMFELDNLLQGIDAQRNAIAMNWGKLKAASALALACSLDPIVLQTEVLKAYGAMQWIALGVLMPNKYAIYWQRDYSGSKGPSCYYNGDASSGNGCSGSDMGCWSPPSGSWSVDYSDYYSCGSAGRDKGEGGNTKCFNTASSGGGQSCTQTQRYIWVGEVGSPGATPSSDFFTALTETESGPITSYVNLVYGTNYQGASGGFDAFVSQCQYMPKLYIPPSSNNELKQSTTAPSMVGLPCNVYGITLQIYAFADCNTNLDIPGQGAGMTGTCVNGYGSSFGATDSMWASGNYNQQMYIPNVPGNYATNDDGQIACCTPWLDGLQGGCDYMLCDCWSLAQGGNNNWLNEGTDGQSANSGSWWGSCEVVTDTKDTQQMMTTSEGPACNWTTVIESGNDFSACR